MEEDYTCTATMYDVTYLKNHSSTRLVHTCSAGYETTSVTLTYTIFAIASFPEVEQRVLEEVDAFW